MAFAWFVDRRFTVSNISIVLTRSERDILTGLRSFTVLTRSGGNALTGLRSFTGSDMFACRAIGILICKEIILKITESVYKQ